MACAGQWGDQAQPAWIYERWSCLTNLVSFCDRVTLWMRKRLQMLSLTSLWHHFLPNSPGDASSPWLGQVHSSLGKNLSGDQAQRIVTSRTSYIQVATGHKWWSQGTGLRPVLFNVFTNNLNKGTECILSQSDIGQECWSADQSWSVISPDLLFSIEPYIGKFYRGLWAGWIDEPGPIVQESMRQNNSSCIWVTATLCNTTASECLESCSAERDLRVLVNSIWTWSRSVPRGPRRPMHPGLYQE